MADTGKPQFRYTTVGEHLAHAQSGEVTRFLIPGMLVEGGSTVLYAPPGSGKSLVVMALALSASQGGNFLGIHQFAEPIKVLYLDQDGNNTKEFNSRLLAFGARDENPNLTCLMHQGILLTNTDQRAALLEDCLAMGIKLFIIDSLTRVHDLSEKSETDMKKVSAAIKEFTLRGITVVMLHHSTKGGTTYRGNNEIAAGCDGVFKMEKISDDLFSMTNEKARSVGENGVWQGCQIVVDKDEFGNLALFGSEGLDDSGKKTGHETLCEGIVDILRNGDQNPTTVQKKMKLSGRDLDSFNKALTALLEDGLIESHKNPKGKGLIYSFCGDDDDEFA